MDERATVRMQIEDVNIMDELIACGEFSSRSEVVRHAINDYVMRHGPRLLEKYEIKKRNFYSDLCGGHPDESLYKVVMDGILSTEPHQKDVDYRLHEN